MTLTSIETPGSNAPAPTPASVTLKTTVRDLLADRDGRLPVWIRSPKSGPELFTGFSRSKLYELAGAGLIRSVSIRQPGQLRGTRLFNLQSILDFISRFETKPVTTGGE